MLVLKMNMTVSAAYYKMYGFKNRIIIRILVPDGEMCEENVFSLHDLNKACTKT